jgi:hypothetical protein
MLQKRFARDSLGGLSRSCRAANPS